MINKSILILGLVLLSSCGTKVKEVNTSLGNQMPEFVTLFEKGMEEGVLCYRIPSIVTAPNGDLIAAIDQRVPSCGDLKWSRDINIIVRRSQDNGKTWSDIETVVNFPDGYSASDPSMIVDKETGDIFMFYNYMDLETERDVYYLHVVKSSDNGKTWSKPEDITSQIAKPEWHNDFKFITSGRGIQTSSGKLLHTMVNLNKGLHVFGSDNHGKSWYFISTPIMPADESKIVELVDGTLMINARVNKTGMRYVHKSQDEGQTWETKTAPDLIDPGCNASIIRYTSKKDGFKKDRLLFSNAKSENNRINMTVRISYDEGKTWSEGKTIYTGSSAYSSLTILKNGEIGIFFEKDEYSKNDFARFSLEWLTDGKDAFTHP
ncbi:sialidase family protein [Aestuariibaculum suncheonense]|uniref:exo-alpha-sialidase n=1 Tax=Aestuariibaculum suncheonense TaxID=1028745 RepID=A0A8J6Q538_9FLAO|nr:sialidase family protein [Aestuariibaculum suncheonense]MBD0835253.1 exo-alpha-sialidase [Aestuariibaculum suncheonense]